MLNASSKHAVMLLSQFLNDSEKVKAVKKKKAEQGKKECNFQMLNSYA